MDGTQVNLLYNSSLVEKALLWILKDLEGIIVEKDGERIIVFRDKKEIMFMALEDCDCTGQDDPGTLIWMHKEPLQ